ncbi:MAG: hypothetical protein V7720_05270 [Halioglobus sp.]
MNRFNLRFWGEILPGKDPQQVKARFGILFGIEDPQRLEHFFSGDTIILRRNLDRKVAGEYYHKLHKLGVEAELVKVDAAEAAVPAPTIAPPSDHAETQWETVRRQSELEDLNRRAQEKARKAEEKAQHQAQDQALLRAEVEEKQRRSVDAERARKEQEATTKKATAEIERRRQMEHAARVKAEAENAAERKAQELARKKSAEADAKRRLEEEALSRKIDSEKEQLRKTEEAAHKKAAEAEAKRLREEEQARREAEAAMERQRKAEEAAHKKAAEAEANRLREEEQARRKAEAEKERQRKAEEAAREKAAEAEAKRLREEEQARRKAAAEKERQRKAEEAARKKAAEAEAKRLREEEQARKKAQAAQQRKQKAEEAAQKKAAAEEQRRLKAAQLAQEKAEAAQEKRRLAEEQAKKKAAQEAERKKHEAQAARVAAEEAALRQQEAKEIARKKAEYAAREKQRREAEREQKAAEEARRRKEKQETLRKAREAKAKAQAEQDALRQRELQEAQQQSAELEEKAIERGAKALTGTPKLKSTQAKVKSRMELPRKNTAYHSGASKQQSGAPNLYRLQAFRNTQDVRDRPALASKKMRKGLFVGATALAVLLLLLGRFASHTPGALIAGPSAIAASAKGQLLILANDQLLLHDRAGVASESIKASELGLKNLTPPMSYSTDGGLLVGASAANDATGGWELWQCELIQKSCKALSTQVSALAPLALQVHNINGDLFIADAQAGKLLKLSASGEVQHSIERPLPELPVLRLDSGLLFINSAEGPAISVLRYEDQAFGQQLDEVLLLPPAALEREQTRVWDFATSGSYWWVTLYNPGNGDSGLYLFDRDWKFIRELPRDEIAHRGHLVNWGSKILLYNKNQPQVLRYSEAGEVEATVESELLLEIIKSQTGDNRLVSLAWYICLLLVLAITLGAAAYAYLFSLRALVYKSRPTHGAEPLDNISDQIQWIGSAPAAAQQLRHASIACGVLSLAVLIMLIGLGVSLTQLIAAMIALGGPIVALQLLLRSDPEHLGVRGAQLVLVDHRQMYHLAGGSRIQYRDAFVIVDDVVIFTGTALLPALDRAQLKARASEVIQAGIRVDRKTVLVKLIESHHPIAQAAQLTAIAFAAGLLIVVLSQLPW